MTPLPLTEIFILGWALSMDAFAVAVGTGVQLCIVSRSQMLRLSCSFGLFQCLMPMLGWWLGASLRGYISAWDHWIAFALLTFIGLKMIREASQTEEEQNTCTDPTMGVSLFVLSVATSIDALAVGLSLAFLNYSIVLPSLGIGVLCALFTMLGLRIGCAASHISWIAPRAAVIGGLVLIGIGAHILFEHGVFD